MTHSRKAFPARPEVLVLQGGGALGAYQAGVFETLSARDHHPHWVAGISIGAINAAIIAGNPPERAIGRLRAFWDRVSSELTAMAPIGPVQARRWFSEAAANIVATIGVPGFFRPVLPMLAPPFVGGEQVSLYDTEPLRDTLLELIDFKRLNEGPMRLSLGAVNVLTGNLTWFDNRERTIGPEHIMASGALPPGFPPVMVDGEPYWDGGLVCNTPMQYVIDEAEPLDLTIYQIDLFPARGPMPQDISAAIQRDKDIRYSSRTRRNTDAVQRLEELRLAASRLCERLPQELRDDPDFRALTSIEAPGRFRVLLLINRREDFESWSMDFEFSRASVNARWQAGRLDAALSLDSPMWIGRDDERRGMITYDLLNPAGPRVRDAPGTYQAHHGSGF